MRPVRLAALALSLVACGETGVARPFTTTSSLTPLTATVVEQDSATFRVLSSTDGPIAALPQLLACRVGDTTVAAVRVAGQKCRARGVRSGQTAVIANLSNGATVSATLTVVPRP